MKILVLTLLFASVVIIDVSASFFDLLKPVEIVERIHEEVADLDLNFDVDLLDVDLFEGVGISNAYRFEVEPSYLASFHTRVDKWEVKFDLRPGDLLKDVIDIPIYLNIDKNFSILSFFINFKKRKLFFNLFISTTTLTVSFAILDPAAVNV